MVIVPSPFFVCFYPTHCSCIICPFLPVDAYFCSHLLLFPLSLPPHFAHSYWCLLSKPLPQRATPAPNVNPGQAPGTLLKYVFDCILSPKASSKICSFVMEMTVTLLNPRDMFDSGEIVEACDSAVIHGEDLVRPFVPKMLEYLSLVISEFSHKGKAKRFDRRTRNLDYEFIVLSR